MRVHEKVKIYIEEHELEISAIAEKTGMSTNALNAMLDGKKTMYADDLRSICIALDTGAECFIDYKHRADSAT